MAIVLLPGYRITDANNSLVSGGKLYVFEAGTSNPRDVYTESTLTTAHSHPIVADSTGLLPDIYTAEDDLKLRVTDASDNTIWEIDNYSTGGTGSGSGGDVTRTPLSKTANYTVQAADENSIIVMDASGIGGLQGDVTADSETLGAGFVIGVKNIGATGNTLFQGTGSQTVDGASNRLLTTQYEFMDLVSRGAAGWFVLASQGASDVTVTVQQADASSDGNLNYENELGTVRWSAVHKQTSDDYAIERYDSGGSLTDTPLRIDEATGDVETTSLLISASGRIAISRATSSGTYSKPTALNFLGTLVKLRGSGGQGAEVAVNDRGGGGGGGGGYCEKWYLDSELSASEAYTILASNAGTGNSTFKSMSAGAGANTTSSSGGTGGTASGGDINIDGEDGQAGGEGTGPTSFGGVGGGSHGHPGGAGGVSGVSTAQPQDGYGPGTGGGGSGTSTRGNGAAGEIIFIEYFS